MDPIVELLKAVDVPAAAALGVIIALVVDQLVGGILNYPILFQRKNPLYHWNTDRVMPVVTLAIGALYGWFVGNGVGYADNLRRGLLYGAVALAISRIVRKTILGGTPQKPEGKEE